LEDLDKYQIRVKLSLEEDQAEAGPAQHLAPVVPVAWDHRAEPDHRAVWDHPAAQDHQVEDTNRTGIPIMLIPDMRQGNEYSPASYPITHLSRNQPKRAHHLLNPMTSWKIVRV
jgi:hypothetical protein